MTKILIVITFYKTEIYLIFYPSYILKNRKKKIFNKYKIKRFKATYILFNQFLNKTSSSSSKISPH